MLKRASMVFLTLIIAICAVLIAAKYPTGPNTVSYDEPMGLMISLGMVIILFLPLLCLSLFNNFIVKMISSIYHVFILLSFIVMIPIGFMANTSLFISLIGVIGVIVSVCSMIVTIVVGSHKKVTSD